MAAKYKSKPVVIEAVEWTGKNLDEVTTFLGYTPEGAAPEADLPIKTPEGTMKAAPGAWVIRGTIGEFYPCKAEVFAAKYELAV